MSNAFIGAKDDYVWLTAYLPYAILILIPIILALYFCFRKRQHTRPSIDEHYS